MEEFITLEIAKLAYEKGFNINCAHLYWIHGDEQGLPRKMSNTNVYDTAPLSYSCCTPSELAKWLRDHHQIRVEPFTSDITGKISVQLFVRTEEGSELRLKGCLWERITLLGKSGFTYEEALQNGLKEALLRLTQI